MNFNNLEQDTNCNCLENTLQDNVSFFARKINKPNPLDKDFRSKWDKGQRDEHCEKICGFKGVSINIWNQTTKNAVIKKFLTTLTISPKAKDSIFVFKFLENAGLIKYKPSKDDKYHYNFYKSDDFSLELLENHEIIPLKDFL